MKTLAKLVVGALIVAIAVPIVAYRTRSPCGMLKKEWVERARQEAESAVDEGREAVSGYGENVERLAERVGEMVEDVTEDIADGVAEMRADDMSAGQCLKELWRLKTGREPSESR